MGFEDFQKQVSRARSGSEKQQRDLKTARQRASSLGRRKGELLRKIAIDARENAPQLAQLEALERRSAEAVRTGRADYAAALSAEWARLREFIQFTDPVENIAHFDDDCPILLFPLRLETRFKKVLRDDAIVDQLWVRVFPDDIAINTFESDLSETEVRNARAYWLARWAAGGDEAGLRGAWRALAAAHGPGRAYWLITGDRYVPLNLPDEPEKAEGEVILAIGTETALVAPELGAVVAYWGAVWQAGQDQARLDDAWDDLLAVVSAERAAELVRDYQPANLGDPPPAGRTRDETVVRVEFVLFASADDLDTKLHAWSQPPTSSILPERFVFLAFQGDELALPPQLGNLVPPKLILGPDPAAEQGEDFRLATQEDAEADPGIQEGDLIIAENMRWMFDFDEAVAKGMGFRIDLSSEQAKNGFDRVFVLGIKMSADRDRGAALVEELFEQHQYSRKGLAILKQGTPTNNTEDDGAGYSWRHDPDDSFDIYFGEGTSEPDPTDWFARTDGRWLADMLGIDPARLQAVENYYSTDIAEGRAMQRALWPATMGHFMDSMMNPVFEPAAIETVRLFFTRYVSGRGSIPAIRVGRQPYGILPATDYTRMRWFAPRPQGHDVLASAAMLVSGNRFLLKLYEILLGMDQTWENLRRRVAHVGQPEGDPHQILLDIIGLHPDSVEVYKRYANTVKQVHNIYNLVGLPHEAVFGYYASSYLTPTSLLAAHGYTIDAEHPAPDIFTKSFFENAWILRGDRIDRVPNSEVEPIGIYTVEDEKNYIGWLIEAAEHSHDRLRLQDGFIDDTPPTALLYLLMYHALDLSYIDTSLKLHLNREIMTPQQGQLAYVEPDFIHIEADNETESRWKHLYKADVRITDDPDLLLGDYIARHIDTLDEAAAFRDVLAGLRMLENVPTAALERLLMEHIDTVSYRYDAWMLGFLHLQLETMRRLHVSHEERPPVRGLYVGGYGWLEELRPENKVLEPVELPDELEKVFNPDGDLVEDKSNAGYILAPSQNHAVTAAVLRNGHLSNEDPEDKEALKIKLSSERVRTALQIIEGIQGGQSLSALLGYRFERGLHDRTDVEVDAFIYDLRNAFPLSAKKFKDTAPGPDDPEYESIDQIEASNVMDGVAFLEHIEKTGNKTYPFGLDLPPAPDKEAAINQEVRKLIDVNDAVADLALAESVHQVVVGNYERAAATLDTYSKGNFPPTPDVIKTPRSGIQLTHRVALQLRADVSFDLSDPGVTPRMVAEPAMHEWLSEIMPRTDQIECVVRYVNRVGDVDQEVPVTMDDLGLAHIDLLYLLDIDSEQAMSTLDDRIVYHIQTIHTPRLDLLITIEYTRALGTGQFSVFEMTSLVASLRALLLRSKALTAPDARLPNEAAKEQEQTVSLDPARLQPIIDGLDDIRTRTNGLADYIADLSALIAADDVDAIVGALDPLLADLGAILSEVGRYGLPHTGTGFMVQWQQAMYTRLRTKVQDLIARWNVRLADYALLEAEYTTAEGSAPDSILYDILRRAEETVSSTISLPLPPSPAEYFTQIRDTRAEPFEQLLTVTMPSILNIHNLTDLIQAIQALAAELPPFDVVGIDIEDELKQVAILAGDLLVRAQNLDKAIDSRATTAGDLLASVPATSDRRAQVELVRSAGKTIFGDDFVMVPSFTLDPDQATEWQNTVLAAEHSLRYLRTDLDIDFPLDDWLYGMGRVREKMHHLENTLVHVEGFDGPTLALVPSQFPYREDDFWLGMQFPDKKPGTDEPFSIDEDKLLFTTIYRTPFDPTALQCGLLLDEWTEVIPSRDETIGLTFHYDQPNTEPPQVLLLVTPTEFTGRWRWADVVNTLHATLDMAKKRAVEPDHVDGTAYSLFLPPIVSLASPLPLTASLNLALNNKVSFSGVIANE